jgi:hypothetical protein
MPTVTAAIPPDSLDKDGVHAMSNHLAVILGFIELLLAATAEDDPRHADMVEVRDAAIKAAGLLGRGPAE